MILADEFLSSALTHWLINILLLRILSLMTSCSQSNEKTSHVASNTGHPPRDLNNSFRGSSPLVSIIADFKKDKVNCKNYVTTRKRKTANCVRVSCRENNQCFTDNFVMVKMYEALLTHVETGRVELLCVLYWFNFVVVNRLFQKVWINFQNQRLEASLSTFSTLALCL